ncbi:carboxypeptidase regulatory-like domain-containing protein, partial [Candidatus Roizmanbacteria bacterium]|nr:carboxypeptidase regulatory-like domain-containing protein [Candidatus Roizmanbacteria bacterium]
NKLLVILKGLLNPQKTEVDGQFNFSVAIKPGTTRTFYLDPIPLAPLTHTFTATPNLHPNYSKAYSDLYKPDEAIVEAAGIPEHRDIPLDPGGGAPFRSTPEVITIDSVNFGSQTRYEGTISHPLSIVTLVGKNSQEVARATADKNGAWEIVLDNAKIPQDSSLQVNIIKVDITTLASKSKNTNLAAFKNFVTKFLQNVGFLNGQVLAQDTTAEFQPILSYVEGYAYDSSGQVIPNAIVKIKLEMSDSVYYQTNADEKGFFTLLSRNLPILTYYLEFTHPVSGKSTVMSTSEFVQKNQSYLAENNVNLMTASKNGQSVNPTIPVTNTQSQNLAPTVPVASTNSQLNLILTLVVLVVILGVAGGVLLYIKKKETQPTNLP